MLTLLEPDRYAEARMLLRLSEATSPDPWLVLMLALSLLALILVASGQAWGWFLIGAAVALALSRHGPHWWPGRR